ncbi:Glutathione reductase [Hypoxylon texense]
MSAPTSVHPPLSNPSSSSSSAPEAPGSSRYAPAPKNATGSSSTAPSAFLSPPFQSSSQSGSSRPHPSNPALASTSRSVTSAPTTAAATATVSAATTHQPPRVAMDLNPTLPSRTTQLHVAEARAALVASMSNMLDSELQSRASLLHSNAAALAKQERDVARGTEGLRKENDKLEKLARDTERKIKELGNVQNWAEVLERDFLVLEETMRLVKEGSRSGSDDESCSECSSRSTWSGSYSAEGSRAGSRRGSMNGGTDSNAKKDAGEQGINGKSVMNGITGGDTHKRGDDTKVTVDEAVAASISEAMATNLHDVLEPLTLDPTPVLASAPAPSSAQSSVSKGKEPATEETSDVDASEASVPEPSQPLNNSQPEVAEEQAAIDKNSKPSTTTG